MSNDIMVLQSELTISQQKNRILELQNELHIAQAKKASRLDDSLLSPTLYEHYQKVAVMLSKSGVIPNIYKGKPEDIFVAMSMGYQLGFPIEQSLQDIAVVNGRPCLWGDGLLSLALNHPECQSIDEEPIYNDKGNVIGYRCTVIRKGHKPHTKQFTLQDATLAGLLSRGTVWKSYPERMLQMRARSFAIRDKFADALRGLRIAEIEEEDSRIIEAEVAVTTPSGNTQVDKLKSVLKERSHVKGHIDSIDVSEPDGVECHDVSPSRDDRGDGGESEPTGSSNDNLRVSAEQLEQIGKLLKEKEFSQERIKKALAYYKVNELELLDDKQAKSFLLQLERA